MQRAVTKLIVASLWLPAVVAMAFAGCGDSGGPGGTGGSAGAGGSAGTGGSAGVGGDPGTEFRVGPEGGEIDYTTSSGVGVAMNVPAGSLTEEVVITIAVTSAYDDDRNTIPGLVFDFGPDGTEFDPALQLVIAYDPDSLDGASEDALALYERVGDDWEPLDSTIDTAANTVSAELDSFSIYALLRGFPFPSGWRHPDGQSDFISVGGSDAGRVAVAMDDNGNGIVAWRQDDDTTSCINNSPCDQIFISEFRSGFWDHPDSLSDNISQDGASVAAPQLAMANNGDAIIAYSRDSGSRSTCFNMSCSQVFMSEYRDGSWDHPSAPNDYIGPFGDGSRDVAVGMDDAGNTIIAWWENEFGSPTQILMSEYRGGSWNHPDSYGDFVSPADGGQSRTPRIAMDGNGNALLAWVQEEAIGSCGGVAGCEQAYLSEFRNGSWDHPADSADHVSQDSGQGREFKPFGIAIDMSNSGGALLAFQHVVGPDSNRPMFLSEYRNSSWDHPSSGADNIISLPGGVAFEPSVAMNADGDGLVAWVQGDGGTSCGGAECQQVYVSEYRGGTWAHPASRADGIAPATHPWNASFADPTAGPRVAIDDDGDAIIVWTQKDGTDDCFQGCNRIYMSEYRDGAWTHPANAADALSPTGVNSSEPTVAMGNNGYAILAWSSFASDFSSQIYLSQYFP